MFSLKKGTLTLILTAVICRATLAVLIPSIPNNYTFLASRNVDNGTAYVPTDPGLIGQTIDPKNPPQGVSISLPPGALPGEDSWGLALMYQITNGTLNGDGTIDSTSPFYYDNSAGLQSTWLVGIFWGAQDTSVTFETPVAPAVSAFTVQSKSLQFELWAVDKSALDPAVLSNPEFLPLNVADRTAGNRYNGWMEDAMLTNGSAVKLLRGESTFFEFTGKAYEPTTGNFRFTGESVAYFDIWGIGEPGYDPNYLWNAGWDNGAFLDPAGNVTDMFFTWDLKQGATWDTLSRDFGGVKVVPEPLSIVLLGIGGFLFLRRKS